MTFWTDERIEQLKKLLADSLSASEIGAALGISRNAVIGKVHRAGLAFARPGGRPAAGLAFIKPNYEPKRIRAKRLKANAAALIHPVADLEPEIVANPIELAELELHHCRWPVDGAGLATMFCGASQVEGVSYCPRHCRIAYRPPERRGTRSTFRIGPPGVAA